MKNWALFEELYRIKKLAGLLNEGESKVEAGVGLLLKLDNTTIKEMEKFKQNEQLNRTQMLAGIIK